MHSETYRGVKIRIQKGREWGYTAVRINGHDQGQRMSMDVVSILRDLRATIDHAQAEPDRYSDEWQAGHRGVRDVSAWQNHRCAS